ncbi:hypothetical protein HY793_05515 [Candidatus Desantisbacteria bacterium]|nr:hypothetical protein [Candidatus Desantisbacteria bacterium]
MRRLGLGLMGAVTVILVFCVNYAVEDTGNILLNSGAENGMDNWTAHGSNFTTSSQYGAHSGSRYFYGGNDTSWSQVSQYVDVSEYAEAIDDRYG